MVVKPRPVTFPGIVSLTAALKFMQMVDEPLHHIYKNTRSHSSDNSSRTSVLQFLITVVKPMHTIPDNGSQATTLQLNESQKMHYNF